jgi:hypothetical protein
MNSRKIYTLISMLFLAGCSKTEQVISESTQYSVVEPGIYSEKTPGIGEVSGSCVGKIALTPYNSKDKLSYPLVYDCQTRKFEIIKLPGEIYSSESPVGDLSFTESGYYVHQSTTVDLKRIGRYLIFDNNSNLIAEVKYPDLDAHDLILDKNSFTLIKYIPDRLNASCFSKKGANVELGISHIEMNGGSLFDWSSENQFSVNWEVSKAEEINKAKEDEWKKHFRPIRNCYTSFLLKLKDFETPTLFLSKNKWPLLQLEENDYIHANSIQRINSNGDILVSARHLDTVFIINRFNGQVSWTLGGPYSKMSQNNPTGDPLKGFSHQHSAHLFDDTLMLFDNRNNFPKDASRIVAYKIDPSNPEKASFKYHFIEPNGKRRPAMGYVSLLENNKLVIGWGAVLEQDLGSEQRAISIVGLNSMKEEFFINLLPGWISYRGKSSTEIKNPH